MARKATTVIGAVALAATSAFIATPAHAAGETVLDFSSTTRADYNYLEGSSTVGWAPWTGGEAGLNAADLGADNWNGDADWGTHNFKVINGVLYVHKGQAGCDYAGIRLANLADGSSVISATNNTISMKVSAADANVKYTAYATDINDGNKISADAVASAAGESTITFTFTGVPDISFTKLWLTPDSDLAAAGNTHDDWGCGTFSATVSKLYKIDDVTYTVSSGSVTPPREATSTTITFETGDTIGAAVLTDGGFFAGAGVAIADAPAGGLGGKALAYTKAGEPYAGVNLIRHPSSTIKYTDAAHKQVSMNFYSPKNGDVPVVLELNPGAIQVQVTAKKGWQTLTFDFATKDTWSAAADYIDVTLFADFQVAASNPADVYYVDNVSLNGATAPAIARNPTVTTPAAGTVYISTTKTLSFTVRDSSGAVVPNATVVFSKNRGAISRTSGVTNASGVVTVVASNTAAGSQSVIAAYSDGNGGSGSATATITWAVPKPTITVSNSKRVITVAVTNAKGKKMTVSITGLKAATKTFTGWTKVSTSYSVKKAGKYTVKVTMSGVTSVTKVYTIK